jgi:hypothetical protein
MAYYRKLRIEAIRNAPHEAKRLRACAAEATTPELKRRLLARAAVIQTQGSQDDAGRGDSCSPEYPLSILHDPIWISPAASRASKRR